MKIQWLGHVLWLCADLLSGRNSESPDDHVDQALARTFRRVANWLLKSK
ncbi:hypothetical protein [Kibdelosporangium aridum]|uniref:Uncharacterized protein n=1 Tax=Kibdelosporangium aridum TaxID=2030 RepID=A0A1Y5XJH9_KIBAR|nr:hypothetical protein [Kibdelosporangium aridum]SMC98970.1 hypothetical protein SAMN05661093_03618 [Kibdelosporangium aridum]